MGFFFLKARSTPGLFDISYLFLLLLFIIVISRRFKKYFGEAKQNLPGLYIVLLARKSQNKDPKFLLISALAKVVLWL